LALVLRSKTLHTFIRIVMRKIYLFIILLSVAFAACKKWEDKAGDNDNRLSRPYCNDPEAANYNVDFPGTPDNSKCYYPYELFVGTYQFADSTFYSNDYLFGQNLNYTFNLRRKDTSKRQLLLSGFCNTDISFTADKYYKAIADSTDHPTDSTKLPGQIICNPADTLSGFMSIINRDSGIIRVNFAVLTDTGIVYHTGRAIRK
jgi:hypothetical protein